jgi:hypothetical protein
VEGGPFCKEGWTAPSISTVHGLITSKTYAIQCCRRIQHSLYRAGFGNINGEFWIGLENLHQLVTNRNSSLRITIGDWDNESTFAEYKVFHVGDEASTNYTLTIDGYSGSAGNSFGYHSGMQFSTPDRDNDPWNASCAANDGAGWWYNQCSFAALNSRYYDIKSYPDKHLDGITWYHWKEDYTHVLKKTEMKTREMMPSP